MASRTVTIRVHNCKHNGKCREFSAEQRDKFTTISLIMLFGIISSDWWQRNPVRNNIKANDDNFSCVLCVLNQQSIRTAAILGLCPVEDAFLPHTVNNTVVKFGSNLA